MTITRKTITEAEFMKMKKLKPFSTFRQDSKKINFGLIFNMSYVTFSKKNLETEWTLARVEAFIEEKGLQDSVLKMQERHQDQGIDPELYKYYAVADYIKTQFFETYPGLLKRIKRNEEFAKQHGYLRSFHGAIRRLPLMPMAYNAEGKLRKHEDKKVISNWINIASNTTIQADESITINWCIVDWDDPRADVAGTVHDSTDFYADREEIVSTLKGMKEHFERLYPEWQGKMVWPVDITVVDLTKEGDYYKEGTPWEEFIKDYE
jgi:hypothetical protein